MTTIENQNTSDHSRVVTVKQYTTPSEAYLDAELLENNGIACSIDGAIGGSVLPFIQGQVRLRVAERDARQAVELVPGAGMPDEND